MSRTHHRLPAWALGALAIALVLGACTPVAPADPYADPGTAPPAAITDPTIATSGSIAPRPGSASLMNINVAGFADPTSGGLPDLGSSDFTVVEDGVVKGITVTPIGGTTTAAADIVFVFDTTGSMFGALNSVQDSIIAFVDFVSDRGLDVRVGAVTFGDAFDTQDVAGTRGVSLRGDTPPAIDWAERPTFPLSSDYDAFRTFIEGDSARGGGDTPENGVGALAFAYEEMDWRAGAQKILIVIIDTCSHNDVTFPDVFGPGYDDWLPPNPADLLAQLQGNAVVHSVSPLNVLEEDWFCDASHTDMAMFTGVAGTGGIHVPVAFGMFDFDLTELPIAEVAGGYIVTFRGTRDGSLHTVRVVIDDDGDIRGEFTIEATY